MLKNRNGTGKPTIEETNAQQWLKENKRVYKTIHIEMNCYEYDAQDIKLGDHLRHIDKSQSLKILEEVDTCMNEKNMMSAQDR